MNKQPKGFWPALALFFLAPAIGELLSGSSPPAEFFNPFVMLLLAALYGSGAILVRELSLRWGKGWKAIFVLGATYGIVEEGLMVKSFFDPNWVDLGVLGTYGRWAGVNWVWSVELTIYHAVFSIAIPIFLVELAFPSLRHEPWVGRRGLGFLAVLLAADVVFGFLALTPYRPPFGLYLLAIIAAALLYSYARRLPAAGLNAPRPTASILPMAAAQVARPAGFALLGFGGTFAWFILSWVVPNLPAPVPVALLAMISIAWAVTWLARRMSGQGAWQDQHRLALASGALGFFILLAPLQQMDTSRPDNTSGMALVGLAASLGLVWLWRRVQWRQQTAEPGELTPKAETPMSENPKAEGEEQPG